MPRRSLLLGYLAPSGLRVRLRPPCFSNAPTRRCGERRAGTLPPARRAWLVGADGPSTVLTRFKLLLASHSCSAHSTKANNGIPIVTTFSSVSGALTEQLIFEFASLSSWPMDCADFLRNLISIRTAIPHYLNKYRTITTTDTKAARSSCGRGSSCAGLADVSATKRPAERALSVMRCIADTPSEPLLKGYFTMGGDAAIHNARSGAQAPALKAQTRTMAPAPCPRSTPPAGVHGKLALHGARKNHDGFLWV